jgi:hypothetical protein
MVAYRRPKTARGRIPKSHVMAEPPDAPFMVVAD